MKYPFNKLNKPFSTLNPKLLHVKATLERYKYVHCSPHFLNSRMHFYLRKVLKENNVRYTYYRESKYLVVDEHPFQMVFSFDDLGYVGIKRMSNQAITMEYQLLAPTVQKLWDKMYIKGIIGSREYKALIVSQVLMAQQSRGR